MTDDQLFESNAQNDGQLSQLRIHAEGFTATGTRHVMNQDRFLVDSDRHCFVVADGMGGMRAGEHAAQMAVDLLPNHPALLALEEPAIETMKEVIVQTFFDVSLEIETDGKPRFSLHWNGDVGSPGPADGQHPVRC